MCVHKNAAVHVHPPMCACASSHERVRVRGVQAIEEEKLAAREATRSHSRASRMISGRGSRRSATPTERSEASHRRTLTRTPSGWSFTSDRNAPASAAAGAVSERGWLFGGAASWRRGAISNRGGLGFSRSRRQVEPRTLPPPRGAGSPPLPQATAEAQEDAPEQERGWWAETAPEQTRYLASPGDESMMV